MRKPQKKKFTVQNERHNILDFFWVVTSFLLLHDFYIYKSKHLNQCMESSRQVCQKIGSIWPCLGHCKILMEKINIMYVDQEYTFKISFLNLV